MLTTGEWVMGNMLTGIIKVFHKKNENDEELEENILPELKAKMLQNDLRYQRLKRAEQLKKKYKIEPKKETVFLEDAVLVEEDES